MPLSLASFKSRLVLPFWYQLAQVVLKKRPLNGCSTKNFNVTLGPKFINISWSVAEIRQLNFFKSGDHLSSWFIEIPFLTVRANKTAIMHQFAKFREHRSNHCWDITFFLWFQDAGRRNLGLSKTRILTDLDKILHNGRYPRCNHLSKFRWLSVKWLLSGRKSNSPFPINFHRHPYNTLGLLHECVIIIKADIKVTPSWYNDAGALATATGNALSSSVILHVDMWNRSRVNVMSLLQTWDKVSPQDVEMHCHERDRFSKYCRRQIPKKTIYVSLTETVTLHSLCCYTN